MIPTESADAWRGVAADIERVATPAGRSTVGCYVIEGTRLHERAVRSGVAVLRAIVARSMLADRSPRTRSLLAELAERGCALHPAPDEILARLTGGRGGGAIMGLVPVPPAPPVSAILARRPDALILAAVDVEDPGNVGALARTALASGAAAFATAGLGDAFHPKAVRTSMGALFKIPVLRHADAVGLLEALRAHGVRTLGAVSSGGVPLPELPVSAGPTAVLMGSEAFGLPQELSCVLDGRVSVPMSGEVDSFSVNAAAAILLYALRHGR